MSEKKALFIDRDGTILVEPQPSEQVDSFEKFAFVPGAISGLKAISGLGYELVLATNQDGLGTESFPWEDYIGPQELMLKTLKGEGVEFSDILVDRSFPADNLPTRKPGVGMFGKYLAGDYDLAASYVIGDRATDVQLAANLGCKAIQLLADVPATAAAAADPAASTAAGTATGVIPSEAERSATPAVISSEVEGSPAAGPAPATPAAVISSEVEGSPLGAGAQGVDTQCDTQSAPLVNDGEQNFQSSDCQQDALQPYGRATSPQPAGVIPSAVEGSAGPAVISSDAERSPLGAGAQGVDTQYDTQSAPLVYGGEQNFQSSDCQQDALQPYGRATSPQPVLRALSWAEIAAFLRRGVRRATVERNTRETQIKVTVDLDEKLPGGISTGLKFFDHMLDQIAHHSGIGLQIEAKGDLEVDEHHTMEDVAIALGEALKQALGSKRGIGRYGFALPMDECEAMVLLDLGGRIDFAWDVNFTREYVGDTPTEMFRHFYKSLCEALQCNLHIRACGENNHHLAEAVFKAFARTLRQAVACNPFDCELPSSKGTL